jgi:hypothetical protein
MFIMAEKSYRCTTRTVPSRSGFRLTTLTVCSHWTWKFPVPSNPTRKLADVIDKTTVGGQAAPHLPCAAQCSYAGVVDSAWRLDAIEVRRPSDPHDPGVVNLRTAMAMMHKASSDAQAWFIESDGQCINRTKTWLGTDHPTNRFPDDHESDHLTRW